MDWMDSLHDRAEPVIQLEYGPYRGIVYIGIGKEICWSIIMGKGCYLDRHWYSVFNPVLKFRTHLQWHCLTFQAYGSKVNVIASEKVVNLVIFIGGRFGPLVIVVACMCMCVRPSVCVYWSRDCLWDNSSPASWDHQIWTRDTKCPG